MITFKAEFDKPEGVQGIKGVWSAKCRRDFLEVFCIIRVYLLLQENFVSKMLFERCIVYPLFVVWRAKAVTYFPLIQPTVW